ncbi:MAG: hypothetical protein WDM84_05025 [Bauldia sp.]
MRRTRGAQHAQVRHQVLGKRPGEAAAEHVDRTAAVGEQPHDGVELVAGHVGGGLADVVDRRLGEAGEDIVSGDVAALHQRRSPGGRRARRGARPGSRRSW